MKIVDCRGGFNRRIIEKSSGHFLTAGRRRPFFCPANGQFFIATWRGTTCRRLLPLASWYPRHCASNGCNIIDFGLVIIVFDGYVGKY
jgi:hypothetical protein